jgi:Flp pilus assembly protein TadG
MKIKRCFDKKICINNKGQSLVELAITLPIILILIFAMMAIGFYIYDMSVYTFASNKALDKGIGTVISGTITQSNLDDMKSDALNYTNVGIFVSEPTIDVTNDVNTSTGESKLTVSIQSNYNFNISFVNDIMGTNPIIKSKNIYIYKTE